MKKMTVYAIGFLIIIIFVIAATLMLASNPKNPNDGIIDHVHIIEAVPATCNDGYCYTLTTTRSAIDPENIVKVEILDKNTGSVKKVLSGEKLNAVMEETVVSDNLTKQNITITLDNVDNLSSISNRVTFITVERQALPIVITGADLSIN